jgi:hypothetical protein
LKNGNVCAAMTKAIDWLKLCLSKGIDFYSSKEWKVQGQGYAW